MKQYRVIEDGLFYTVEEQTFFGRWVKTKHRMLNGLYLTEKQAINLVKTVMNNKKPQKKVVWESSSFRKI